MTRITWGVMLLALVPWMAVAAPPPRDIDQRAGFDQHVGASLPMQAVLMDADGHPRTLAQVADGKPLLLAFGYYRCPNLCDLTLHGMAKAIATMPLAVGADYRVVFASIDPADTAANARDARDMLQHMEPGAHADRWTFATLPAPSRSTLPAAAGFRYFFDTPTQQFVHPAGLVVATADGRIAQYFFGVGFEPGALRLAVVNASEGHLGSVIDRLVLLCCGFDPATGRYSLLVSRLMMVLGCVFVLAMLVGLWRLRRPR
jgi:protein SCO1